jgi:AcrR family transcriptional regulator
VPANRDRLNRDRVLRAAVDLADRAGISAVNMRSLAQELDVVPMALYKHVANKEELLDGMVDVVVGEIEPTTAGSGWKEAVRDRVLSARRALLRHPWASRVIETRGAPSPVVLDHMESLIAALREGGLSPELTHYAMHALGSRMWGFTQEVFPSPPPPDDPVVRAAMVAQMAARYPRILEIASSGAHREGDRMIVGPGCDDQHEFEFALDLFLDGIERMHERGWTPQGGVASL